MSPSYHVKLKLFVIITICSLSYILSIQSGYLNLDDVTIIRNLSTTDHSLNSFLWGGGGDYFRPITIISFILDFFLFGENPSAFHLVNVFVHIVNTLLVFHLAFLLLTSDQYLVSSDDNSPFIASLLFALHPVNTEAVMWISARTDLLCCFFFLAALIVVVDKQLSIVRSTVAIFLLMLFSLLSKESSVGLTAIMLCFWVVSFEKGFNKRIIWLALASFLATSVYMFMRSGVQTKPDAGVSKILASGTVTSFWQICYDSIAAFGFYATKTLYPFPLNFAIVTINKPVSVLIFVVVMIALIILFVRTPRLRLPILIFTVCLVPPVMAFHGKLPWTPYAERYLYLPMIGFALICGYFVNRLPRKIYLVAFTFILLISIPTLQRVILWSDPTKFWRDVLQKSPEFPRSYAAVAFELIKEKKYDEAENLLNKSLKMGLNKDYVWLNLALVRLGKGDLYGYETAMLQSAELVENPTQHYINLIHTVSKNSNDEAAQRRIISYYLKAQERDPRFGDGLYNAAKMYLHLGETKNALFYFRKFITSPGDSMYQPFAEKFIHNIEQGNYTHRLLP